MLSFAAALAVDDWQNERARLAFEEDARNHVGLLQRGLNEVTNELLAIGALYKASREVDRDEFNTFARDILLHTPIFQALEWVPRIKHDEREDYLATMRRDFPDFQIRQFTRQVENLPAAGHQHYYPVSFVEPQSGNEAALGLDLASLPAHLETLQQARDSGELATSGRLKLVQGTGDQTGFLCVLPVYRNNMPVNTIEQRRKNLLGFIVGVFRIGDLAQTILADLKETHINLQIHDGSTPLTEKYLLYSKVDPDSLASGRNGTAENRLSLDMNMTIADRQWSVHATGMRGLYSGGTAWQWLIVLLVGSSFSILITAFLLSYIDRTKKIEQQVRRRTNELNDSKLYLEREIAARKRTGQQLSEREASLNHQHELLGAISTAQSRFIRDTDVMALFDKLLVDILSLSDSEYGFIGEILYNNDQPYMKTLAISNIAWNTETSNFYEDNAAGGLEFTNLDTLFGAAITTRATVIANEPAADPRSGGLPSGHPPLNAFLGVPFFRGDKVIGMFGIANRAMGYDQALVEFLEPITATCTQIVEALKADRQREVTEEQLRERETRMRTIFNNVIDGIITTNEHGCIETFNRAAENMFGYTASEVIGRNVSILTPETHQARHDAYIRDFLNGRESKIMGAGREVEGIRKDGSAFPIDIAVTEMWVGEDRHFCSIMRDITERKKIERMKNEFISTVSHELRTPLTSIRGALGLVGSGTAGDLPEKAQPLIDIATKNCDRLIRLINDILDIEKIEANKMEYTLQPLKLMQLVNQAVDSNRVYASDYGADILVSNELEDAVVLVDEDRFTQVLTNLLSNAAKYSPRGGQIVVTTHARGDGVRVSVSDEGPGIPQEFRTRIFEKFTQVDGSDTRQKGGTGLGLNITKAIIERLGGQITFDTEAGKGTSFHVDLPLHTATVTTVARTTKEQPASSGPTARILVCEDDADIARLLVLMLQSHGYDADIAHTAGNAKALLEEREYAAMTLDLMLPDQYGIDLFRDVRQNEKTRELPVIVVSAIANEERQQLSGDAIQIIDWIDKPIDEHKLIEAVSHSVSHMATGPGHILHVEDEFDVHEIVSSIVGNRYQLTAVRTLAEAENLLNRQTFDLVILDLGLPDGSGVSLLPVLAQSRPRIPVVLFSAREVDAELARGVAAALIKSKTTNETLIDTINTTIASQLRPAKEA
ncbi:MAG: CHASE domain-containing protein [Gammaproteobacteria bacterium]